MKTSAEMNEGKVTIIRRLIRGHQEIANLLRKEFRESREILIAGLVIFWVAPVLMEIMLLLDDPRYESAPFAWVVLMAAGWLYAIIVGAHVVCRDWGKAEENFLLAQPVSPRLVVWAKLRTGAAVIMIVVLVAALWDWGMASFDRFPGVRESFFSHETLSYLIPIACITAVGYAVAFAAAIVTRQMLVSALVAGLVLLIWAVAPWLSSHLTFLIPGWPELEDVGSRSLIVTIECVIVCIVCIGIALYSSTRERHIRVGHKQIAWAFALVMLALFGVAMTEVGNSLVVRDQAELFDAKDSSNIQMVYQGDRFFALKATWESKWQMAKFRIDDKGRMRDLQRAEFSPSLTSNIFTGYAGPENFRLDEKGYWIITKKTFTQEKVGLSSSNGMSRLKSEGLCQIKLAWPDGSPPTVISQTEVSLPANMRSKDWNLQSTSYSEHYAYLVYQADARPSTPADKVKPDSLYVFDWLDGPNPNPRYEISLPRHVRISFEGDKLILFDYTMVEETRKRPTVATFDANHPETLSDKRNWIFQAQVYQNELQEFQGLPEFYFYQKNVRHGDLAYLSGVFGLRIVRQTGHGGWKIVGECRVSPLAMVFRFNRRDVTPFLVNDKVLVESGRSGLTAYDVSNPAHPRRIGFFNTVNIGYSDEYIPIYATQNHLVLREGYLITVLDQPR